MKYFDFLVESAPSTEEGADGAGGSGGWFNQTSTKMYIVIAAIAALVFIALVQASCTIYKMSKKSSVNHKVKQI